MTASLAALAMSAPSAMIGGVRNDEPAPKSAEALMTELHGAFNEYRTANDDRMTAIENNKGTAELDAKIAKLENAMSEAEAGLAAFATQIASGAVGSEQSRVVDQAYTDNFNSFMRLDGDRQVPSDISNVLQKTPDSDGGYLVPTEWDRSIQDALVEVSAIRQLVNVQTVSGGGFKKLINLKGTAAGWVGETDARPQTASATFDELDIGWGEIYAMPAATQNLLDDASIDIEKWLAGEVQEAFMLKENPAFVAGDGVKKPRGFLTYVPGGVNADRHPLGSLGLIASGGAAAVTTDAIIDMVYSPAKKYRARAQWAMNRLSLAAVRKLTDSEGNYLWQPTLAAGQPSTLAGYGIAEIEDMPDLAANAFPIAFGDFKAGYSIFDRQGVSILRDPYTNKPYVLFYTTKRVGGAVTDPNAIKVMKIAAAV